MSKEIESVEPVTEAPYDTTDCGLKLPGTLAGNLGEPIKLTGVKLAGVAAESARSGTQLKVWTRLSLTSDEPFFHRVVENLGGVIAHHAREAGKLIMLNQANSVLMVIHPDDTGELWVDTVAVSIFARVKRNVAAGNPVFDRDIADVTGMWFPCVEVKPADRILYLFRQEWRFGLFFDFNPDGNLSFERASRDLGTLFRHLRYRHLYDVLADKAVFGRLLQAGWFPFVEIIGDDFRKLALACEAGFELDDEESRLVQAFDQERLDRMFARWIARPHFKSKERILRSALNAYINQDPVAVLKIVLTEIEGLLREAHKTATGKMAPTKELLKFAVTSAEQRAGAPNTLMFPSAFAEYLEAYTFAKFDPMAQSGCAGSRHAVGHGAADAGTYTQARALQALLTLDQLAFYT